MNLYEKVTKIAAEKELPIRKVEKLAGVANGTIGGWRESDPKVSTLKKVADALKIGIEELI